jgi:hypothetical protein
MKVLGADLFVSDVAPAATGDEDLRPDARCAIQQDNVNRAVRRLSRKDPRGQSRCAGSNDGDVCMIRHRTPAL